MPAKPLTSEQKADADRLRAAWEAFKSDNPHVTQEWLADQCGWKTQAAVSQYLLGKIPLNLPALLKLSGVIGVKPSSISPALAGQLPDGGMTQPPPIPRSEIAGSADTWPFSTPRADFDKLSPQDKASLDAVVSKFVAGCLAEVPLLARKKKVIEFTGLHPETSKVRQGVK